METVSSDGNFGEKRERGASVSYLEIEQAAISILLARAKPSIQSVRKALGDRGSSQTIHAGLRRFWRELGLKAQGDPAALSRLPIEIAESVEAIWQRALTLATQTAKTDDNEARAHLERLKIANEVQELSLSAREKELELQGRERERLLADTRDHLLSTLRSLSKHQEEVIAKERRIVTLQAQVEDYRTQLAAVLAALAGRERAAKSTAKQREVPRKPTAKGKPRRRRVKRATGKAPARRRPR